MIHGRATQHRTATARGNSVKSLIERRLTSIVDQPGAKVFPQGLMGAGGTLARDPAGVFWKVFDLTLGIASFWRAIGATMQVNLVRSAPSATIPPVASTPGCYRSR